VTTAGPRLGLCCAFVAEPIKFRTTTARYLATLAPRPRRTFLGALLLDNAAALESAIAWCAANGIGAFRITSQLFPVYTHPQMGYDWRQLPIATLLEKRLARVREAARRADVRLSFHPDQFVVPGSPNERAARASLSELEYMAEAATLVGAEQLTIHGGGGQEGKPAALARLRRGLDRLSPRARGLVVLENDDRLYTPDDLLPICRDAGLPLVYDVHHHRCNPDALSIDEATVLAAQTWGRREPWFHLSSPVRGWQGGDPRPHHDYISTDDLPARWRTIRGTIDVEAKAKERAVLALGQQLGRQVSPPRKC
jgi:UV DNA damage endonuclease